MGKKKDDAYQMGASGQRYYGSNGSAGLANQAGLKAQDELHRTNNSGMFPENDWNARPNSAPSGNGAEAWFYILAVGGWLVWVLLVIAGRGFWPLMEYISNNPLVALAVFAAMCVTIKFVPKFLGWLIFPETENARATSAPTNDTRRKSTAPPL